MARPVDADSARTYDSIVRAALDVLAEAGLPERLSMRKVAAAAEVSPGTIQSYVGSKRDLLEGWPSAASCTRTASPSSSAR